MSGHVNWLEWVFKFVNFGVLVAILVKFAAKPFKNAFVTRSRAVQEKIDESARLLREAETLRTEYERRLAALDEEIATFKKGVLADAEREKAKILAEASAMTARIHEQARLMYQQEMKDVQGRMKGEIVRLALARAETVLAEKMTKADHDKMVEEFMQKLGSIN
jgi:F-type H+-transporting ATPase subunit b